MELRHLRYFLTAGEALKFTKAAAQLRLAQPPLSRQVQDLEEDIGVDLLRRSPRGCASRAELGSLPKTGDELKLLHAMGWETASVQLGCAKQTESILRLLFSITRGS